MACPEPDRVLDYLAHRLDPAERDAIEAHVDACAACRQLLVELARTEADAIVPRAPASEPTQIGRYRVEARLGEGGMGTVYAAYDPQLDRKVAVKLVHPELAERGGVERLLREGRALAKVVHPNVVGVHDAGTDGARVYIGMELVAGETLAAWLRGAERSWRDIARKFVAAGRGLAAAHRQGIIHRDVKPENILLDRDGRPKVADFGLAGHSEPLVRPSRPIADPTSRLTHPGTVMGTPAFMSPEQRRGDDVTPATDQYSLCAALANALGQRRLPRWLRHTIARGMAAEPGARFPSIDALVAALDPDRRARRTRLLAVAAGAVVLLGGATGAAYYLTRAGDDTTGAACDAAAAERARLATPAERAAIAAALRATKLAYAEPTWKRVSAALDAHLTELDAAQRTLCDQRPRSAEARALLEHGLACLADRRAEVADLTGRLARIAAGDVRFAVRAVHELSPITDCANPQTLAAEARARSTPALGQEVAAARRLHGEGKYRDAVTHAQHAVELARPFGGAVLAKALLVLADVSSIVDGFPATEAAAREAATAAEAGGADELRALAMADLMSAMAREPGREKEAIALEPLVTAAIERGGRRSAYMPIVKQAVGMAQLRLGQFDASVANLQAALAAAREVLPAGDPRMPEYVYPVGVALSFLRRDAEAIEYHAEAYQTAVAAFGEDHPETARFVINLAAKHAALGDCAKALAELTHARAMLDALLPRDSAEHLQISQTMGACYYIQHEYDDALREYRGRQAALTAAGRTKSAEMAGSWVDVGDVELDRKDFAAAADSYRRSVTEYEALVGTEDARLGLPLSRLGEAELGADHPERAIEPLQRALAIYAAAKVPPIAAADVQFPLARALWTRPAQRPHARELATTAHAAFAASGPMFESQAKASDAWLRAHR